MPRGGGLPCRARLPHVPGAGRARSSTAPATGTPPCWPTPSPPSTTCPAAGPTSASGAGWAFNEYGAYGIPFPSAGERLDLLEESIQAIRGLLRDEVTDFSGKHVTLTEPGASRSPCRPELPIWVGGSGEKRTLRIAARYADGWNVPFVSPETVAHKRNVLADHCATVGRDPAEIRTAVNVGLCPDDDALQAQFGGLAEGVRPGC